MIRAAVQVWHCLRRIAEDVGFLVCPVGNQQFEVLLAEGNLVDGLNAVATASRPSVGSPRSILQAAFDACSISQPHTTVNAALCSTRRPAAAFRCTPQATTISSPALATMCEAFDTVSFVETKVSHNVRNCRDGMFIAFCAHFVFFFTVHSWEEDARGKSHSCLFTDPCVSPILVDLHCFQTVYPSCGTESSELVFSLSASTER